jgi:glycerol-3-phosphate cytidylyltransferase-like family protein
LHFAETNKHFDLLLGKQTLFHVRFQTSQQKRTENLNHTNFVIEPRKKNKATYTMQTLNELRVPFKVVFVEPRVKVLKQSRLKYNPMEIKTLYYVRRIKHIRKQEVEEGPEFVQVVLQRRAGEQETVGRFELSDYFRQLGLLVLDPVRLVNHHVAPVELLEHRLLLDDRFV